MKWMTGLGIAVGGVGGALAALMGTPKAAPVPAPVAEVASAAPASAAAVSAPAAEAASAAASLAVPASAAPVAPAAASAAPATPAAAPAVDVPATREALLKAEMLCDQKKDFDECARAGLALEQGTTGAADPEQAKRFRKIALTHLVTQCESGGSPHACFVLAAKYRTGGEVAANPAGAEALEKRAAELCRYRPAPECPPEAAP